MAAVKSPISHPLVPHLTSRPLSRNPHSLSFPSKHLGLGLCTDAPRRFGVAACAANPSASGPAAKGSLEMAEGDPAPAAPSSSSAASAIDFLTLCHRLKTTKRKGWVNHGITGPESISDHMYRMSLMALIAKDLPGVNRERCIKIAIVHDIAEAIVGDITPSDGVPKEEKSRLEQAALDEMCEILGGGLRADEIKELWAEYENNSSVEASLVKDFDKVEMILQALEYETAWIFQVMVSHASEVTTSHVRPVLSNMVVKTKHGRVLDEFFLSTAGKFQTDIGKSWAAEVTSRRNRRLGKQA